MTPLEPATLEILSEKKRQEIIADCMRQFNVPKKAVIAALEDRKHEKIFLNDTYQVNVRVLEAENKRMPAMLHLSIKRIDKKPVHDWRDLQEIKNQIVGCECECIEIYPAESRLIDTSNQYHLWCLTNDVQFPFGFNDGRKVVYESGRHNKQRGKHEN